MWLLRGSVSALWRCAEKGEVVGIQKRRGKSYLGLVKRACRRRYDGQGWGLRLLVYQPWTGVDPATEEQR